MRISAKTWHKVFVRDNGYCQYCGEDLLISRATFAGAQVDHVLAVANGGQDLLENLKLACPTCNGTLSCSNHVTTFEERKALIEQKLVVHNKNYQEWVSKLRTRPTSACETTVQL
jgi:hypothetical protein